MTPRIERLKENLIGDQTGTPEWLLLRYESLRQTGGKPVITRRAEAFAHFLENVPLEIDDDELLVGRLPIRAPTTAEAEVLEEARAYFAQHQLVVGVSYRLPPYYPEHELVQQYGKAGIFNAMRANHHIAADARGLLQMGWGGITEKITDRLTDDQLEHEQRVFLEASLRTVQAASDFARRYARLAGRKSAAETDPERRCELQAIETVCTQVATEPPSSFREAIQLLWFQFFLMCTEISEGFCASGFELDRHLIEYYERDLERGRITRDEAGELIAHLFVELNVPHPRASILPLIVGGLGPGNEDAYNELSDLCLEVGDELGLLHPSLALRYHKGMPRPVLKKAIRMWQDGRGFPQVFNDDVVLPSLLSSGVASQDAYEWIHSVCTEVTAVGKTNAWITNPYMNMAKPLELVLNSGCSLLTGEQLSEDRGELADYPDYQSVYDAYLAELAKWIRVAIDIHSGIEERYKQDSPLPFLSANIGDCIEKARDFTDGGPRYNPSYAQGTGISTAVDSLVVLKDLVFAQGTVDAAELLDALRHDFEGYSQLHTLLVNYPRKYGNDIDETDQIFAGIAEFFYDEVRKYRNARGGRYHPGFMVFTSHEGLGARTGATPDGRLARTPLSDSVGAVQGMDRNSVTALFRSVTKTDFVPAIGGVTFNVRLTPSFFASEHLIDKLADAVVTYFDLGGFHMQVNVVDSAVLEDARAHPERHRDLMVRVGGFSAYFTDLGAGLQREIIARTAHSETR